MHGWMEFWGGGFGGVSVAERRSAVGGFAKIMNKIPAAILRSPLHPIMSSRYLLLSFTGRKRGGGTGPPWPTSEKTNAGS